MLRVLTPTTSEALFHNTQNCNNQHNNEPLDTPYKYLRILDTTFYTECQVFIVTQSVIMLIVMTPTGALFHNISLKRKDLAPITCNRQTPML
jgi:hypothetical protein